MKIDQRTPRLYIDLLILSPGLGGGLTFVKELIPGVINELHDKFKIVIIGDKKLVGDVLGPLGKFTIMDSGPIRSLFSRVLSSITIYRRIGRSKSDIVWGPLNSLGYLGVPRAKKIVTIHDTMVFDHPKFYGILQRIFRQYQLHRSVLIADMVVTVSHFTRDCVLRNFSSFKNVAGIKVIHEGIELPTVSEDQALKVGNKKRFCLFVGVGRKNKNLRFLVQVHNVLVTEFGYLGSLIIVGNIPSTLADELKEVSANPDLIEFPGFVSNEKKQHLYLECDVFVFPSTYEGFGLPPLEAAVHGAPVVVSDIDVMREVCSEFAWFGNLEDPAEFAATVNEVITHSRGYMLDPRVLSDKFNWQKTIKEYSSLMLDL
jgi:glycosyltransferase involved in cell wall biosynthesis